MLDTILTGKGMFCSQHGITLTCVADGSLLDGISVMDTCTIFGNALDNAIECELLIEPEEKRLIHLSVSEMNQFVLVRIENYLEDNLKFVNGLPVTTKGSNKDHGFGLKKYAVSGKKYGGTMGVDVEQNWFVLKIMLPLRK
ncbi:MAG: ATP-binding protein [Ruminococcus sp.]